MAQADLQAALVRLRHDPAARALLVGDPQAFAEEASLAPEELATLRETAEASLHLFKHSLVHQRAAVVEPFVPQVRAALDGAYMRTFEAFAGTNDAAPEPARDSLHFLRWLSRSSAASREIRQIARYEYAGLLMRETPRQFHAGIYRLPSRPGRFLAAWWRRGGEVRHFEWP